MMGITKTKFLASAGLLAFLCGFWTPAARADGLTITLPSITGSAGDSITVFDELANGSSNPLYFSTDTPTINNAAISGFGDLSFNAAFGLGPAFIDGNSTLTGVDLFTILIAPDAAPGVYTGNIYTIKGGTDPSCVNGTCDTQLGRVAFDVTVRGPVGVREPGTLALLAIALLAAASLLAFRRAA